MGEDTSVNLSFGCGDDFWGRNHKLVVIGNFKYKSKRQKFINELKPLIKKYQW